MSIVLPKDRRFMVIGANPVVVDFVGGLLSNSVPKENIAVVFDRERIPVDVSALSGIRIYVLSSVSEDELMDSINGFNPNIACVFSWYAVLSRRVINHFGQLIFNTHTGELPFYRGAGGFSWQVLNGENSIGAFVHVLTSKLDAGPVVFSKLTQISNPEPYPIDFSRASCELIKDVAEELAGKLAKRDILYTTLQDENMAEYYPKLTTSRNGVIDFSWSLNDVYRFIRAFSSPHPGATFTYNNKRFQVLRAEVIKKNISRHPFAIGLIVNKTDQGLHVLLRDGILLFSNLKNGDGDEIGISEFRIGDRIYNRDEDVLSSRLHRPSYSKK